MFKGSLIKKIMFATLIIGLLLALIIRFPVYHFIYQRTYDEAVLEIQNAGNYLVNDYRESIVNGENTSWKDYIVRVDTTAHFSDSVIWVVSPDGRMIYDSSRKNKEGTTLSPDYLSLLSQNTIKGDSFGDLVDGENVSVVNPVNYNYQLRGYFVLHGSLSAVEDKTETQIFWVAVVCIMAYMFVVLFGAGFGIYYTNVLNRMIKVTVDYSEGKFETRFSQTLSDEHERLANAIFCLAEKNEGLIDYQKNFIANVSHDFRSPLTSIKGYAGAMKDGTIPYEMQGKYLDIILFETDRLTGLTQNLLQLNEFDNKALKLDLSEFNICNMIKQSAATFEAVCANKRLKIRLILAEREIFVRADKAKIQQVLHNLIDNAIKFSNDDNMLVITVEEKGPKVVVSVQDFGIGIPRDSINKVWERFYKTDLSRGKDKKGTGLGLSITKTIINAHNESIICESEVGKGTKFTFSLARVDVS